MEKGESLDSRMTARWVGDNTVPTFEVLVKAGSGIIQ